MAVAAARRRRSAVECSFGWGLLGVAAVDATCDEAMLWKRFDRRVFADSSACAAGSGHYMCPRVIRATPGQQYRLPAKAAAEWSPFRGLSH